MRPLSSLRATMRTSPEPSVVSWPAIAVVAKTLVAATSTTAIAAQARRVGLQRRGVRFGSFEQRGVIARVSSWGRLRAGHERPAARLKLTRPGRW